MTNNVWERKENVLTFGSRHTFLLFSIINDNSSNNNRTHPSFRASNMFLVKCYIFYMHTYAYHYFHSQSCVTYLLHTKSVSRSSNIPSSYENKDREKCSIELTFDAALSSSTQYALLQILHRFKHHVFGNGNIPLYTKVVCCCWCRHCYFRFNTK